MKQLKEPSITDILTEYLPNYDEFCEDSPFMLRIKEIINNELSEAERRIMLLYTEEQSQRKTGELLGISSSTFNKILKQLRRKIIQKLIESDFDINDRKELLLK